MDKETLKVHGMSLTLCTDEANLWWDSDSHWSGGTKPGFGIMATIRWGTVLRPIGKLWKKGFWKRDPAYNPWVSGNHWFVLRFTFLVPFISIAIGNWGLYLGFKSYGVDWISYEYWLDKKYIKVGNRALAPSASIRRTRA